MKLLLDESIPIKFANYLPDRFVVTTVPQMGWAGTKNGKLLALAAEHNFSVLVTADRGMEYQQNIVGLPIAIIILSAYRTRLPDLIPLVPQIVELLDSELELKVYRVTV